jgi:Fur family zinc uptake transcriptional regulator
MVSAQRAPLTPERVDRLAKVGRVQREVFDLLLQSATPMKAYELLWRLQAARGRSAPPSTVYRALALLIEAGLIHRIDGMGAYMVCTGPDGPHDAAFLVCERCGDAIEVNAQVTRGQIEALLRQEGFRPRQLSFTLHGVCARCAAAGD